MRIHLLLASLAAVIFATFARAEGLPNSAVLRIDSGVHSAVVRHVALTRDERMMVTSSFDKTIRVWNLPDGTLRHTFRVPTGDGFEGSGYAVAVNADGSIIAVGGWMPQQYVYLLNGATGQIFGALGPNPDITNHIAFSPDGRRLATVHGTRNGVRLWDIASGRLIAEDNATARDTYALEFGPDGSFITGGYDGILRFYDSDGRRMAALPGKSGQLIDDVDLSPDGKRLAVSYAERSAVDIYDMEAKRWGEGLDLTSFGAGGVASVGWSGDGSLLFIGGQMKDQDRYFLTLQVQPAVSLTPSVVMRSIDAVSDIEPYGLQQFAFVTSTPQIGIIKDANSFTMLVEPNIAAMGAIGTSGIRASENGRLVMFATDFAGNSRFVFDVDTLQLSVANAEEPTLLEPDVSGLDLPALVNTATPQFNGMALSFDSGEWAMTAAAFADRQRFILGSGWYLRSFDTAGTMQWRTAVTGWSWGVTTSRDGSLAIGVFGDGTLRWFRASDGALLLSLFVTRDAQRWFAWTPGGYYAASPEGESLAGWQADRSDTETPEYLPISAYRATYNRPDVLKRILTTLDEGQAIGQ